MTQRQAQFLHDLIDHYIQTAEPVASAFLADTAGVSSATVRNDMAALEKDGYITQPHTSAGRIPTEKGYRHYLASLEPKRLSAMEQKKLQAAQQQDAVEKSLAKVLADLSGLAVLLSFAQRDYYYTGLSQLFSQPEFSTTDAVINITSVLDALDETLEDLYLKAEDQPRVFVGHEQPFSPQCSLIATRYSSKKAKDGIIAILGPQRMDYAKQIGYLSQAHQLLNH